MFSVLFLVANKKTQSSEEHITFFMSVMKFFSNFISIIAAIISDSSSVNIAMSYKCRIILLGNTSHKC